MGPSTGSLTRAARRTRATARRLTGPESQPVEVEDIQGNVLRGYAMDCAAFVFLHCRDADGGRRVLHELARHVTMERADTWRAEAKPGWTLNLAFTATGLTALGVPDDVLAGFPEEFLAGMAPRAKLFLGDTGANDPEHWEPGLRGDSHVLVMIHASSEDQRAEALALLDETLAHGDGVTIVGDRQLTQTLDGAREHFGFTDGFSQPALEGSPKGMRPGEGVPDGRGGWRPIRTGEFVLGYRDEDGALPAAPSAPYGVNGTFMVYRKLAQDVAGFRAYERDRAAALGVDAELLAAKIVGRWRDGCPLILSPERPDAVLGADKVRSSAFGYRNDPDGLACPLGAHVRRANPRDALEGGTDRSRRHRIIRRGMPYGRPLAGDEPDDEPRGLIFICFNASIARQFEVVQNWLLDGNPFRIGDQRDFLLGAVNGKPAAMTLQGAPPMYLSTDRQFVTTRGGEYLFVPGGRALRAILKPAGAAPAPHAIPVADPSDGQPAPRTPVGRHIARLQRAVLSSDPVLAALRTFRPILRTRAAWIVTRDEHVREVLLRHQDFRVPYLIHMEAMTGPFILGFDDSTVYQHERDALARAILPADLARVATVSRRRADRALAQVGSLELVREVVDPAVEAAIRDLFGIPFPDPATLAAWSRDVFREVFLNPEREPRVSRRGNRAADAMRHHIRRHIDGGSPGDDNVLGRLLAQRDAGKAWSDVSRIQDSLFGLIVAWSVSVSRSTALAVDQLLRRPGALAAAYGAARSDDGAGMGALLFEALRFKTQTDLLPRRCANAATIASGTRWETTIMPGQYVIVAPKSAMKDRRAVTRPQQFSTLRPDDDYMHFGYGLHRCFGEHIARAQMAAIGLSLFSRDVRATGRLRRIGPFPARLPLAVVSRPMRFVHGE